MAKGFFAMKYMFAIKITFFAYLFFVIQDCIKAQEVSRELRTETPEETTDFASSNTYHGDAITAENILQIAPRVPQEIAALVENFLTKNKPLGNILSGVSYYKPILFYDKAPFALDFSSQHADSDPKQVYFGATLNAFAKLKLNLKPGPNYILQISNDWILKASGFSNRRENINAQVGNPYGATVTTDQLEKFKSLIGKTFQTISRMAYWLRAQEAIEKFGLNRICLPKEYLVHIPDRPAVIEDANYVIVEEKITGKPIMDTDLAGDPEVIRQLTQLIGYTALWDINQSNVIVLGNRVCIVDMEQPNVHKPLDFFHKDISIHRSNVIHGWEVLENTIIKPYAQRHNKNVKELLDVKRAAQKRIQDSWK